MGCSGVLWTKPPASVPLSSQVVPGPVPQALLQSLAAKNARSIFRVDNITCISCVRTIGSALQSLPGYSAINANTAEKLIFVDHQEQLSPDQIASVMDGLGYPPVFIGTGEAGPQAAGNPQRSSGGCGSGNSSGCGSGGCSTPPAGARNTSQKAPQQSLGAQGLKDAVVTTLQVQNITCGSCLSSISAELQKNEGTLGMDADLANNKVFVLHKKSLAPIQIAQIITGLGYPANPVSTVKADSKNAASLNSSSSQALSSGCGPTGCNASSASWRQLYQKVANKVKRISN
jgi:copper chaperone CopZ